MAGNPQFRPSFSPGRRWAMAFQVCFLMLVVISVVVMANYISRDFYLRAHWSSRTRLELSPRTVQFVASMTNHVRVIIYYNKDESLYSTISDLLREYQGLNHRIEVETVDYLRDPGAAQKIKAAYKLGAAAEKDFVIFDCGGIVFPVNCKMLTDVDLEVMQPQGQKDLNFRRKITAFKGEMMFTGALLKITSPTAIKSYLLQGHGEHQIDNGEDDLGYMKFASAVRRNCVQIEPLSLLGSNPVPADCNLLIVAGAAAPLSEPELAKIDKFLNQGGRLLALFNADSINKQTGLEKILGKWGVEIGSFVVKDPDHSQTGSDVVVGSFSHHPMVNPLLGYGLDLI